MRLPSMGMKKGDRFAALGYNCVEWMEIYAAAAKGGFIVVPIMFRLSAPEMEYNINHSECKVLPRPGRQRRKDGKEFPWIEMVKGMKKNLPTVTTYVSYAVDNPHYDGFISYEDALAAASPGRACDESGRRGHLDHHVHERHHGQAQRAS